jgi:hypothetical protein
MKVCKCRYNDEKNEGLFIKWLYYDEHSKDLAAHLMVRTGLLSPAPTRTGTIALDPTFGSYT